MPVALSPSGPIGALMSDVGDVHRAHSGKPESDLDLYIKAARRMLSQNASTADRISFMTFHSASNVTRLGDLIDQLRAENSALLDAAFHEDEG